MTARFHRRRRDTAITNASGRSQPRAAAPDRRCAVAFAIAALLVAAISGAVALSNARAADTGKLLGPSASGIT